jgi:hypothetical protein
MSLGLQIAATGATLMFVSGALIWWIRRMPSPWIALPLLAGYFGGMVAMPVGYLWWVWS